jgi:hypothetical protein
MSDALDLLQHDELCLIILKDGTQREATWSKNNKCFYAQGGEPGPIDHEKIEEWIPAARF